MKKINVQTAATICTFGMNEWKLYYCVELYLAEGKNPLPIGDT